MDRPAFETVIQQVQFGELGFDVRCFLVPHESGVVLVDTGTPGAIELIGAGLARIGAEWSDVTDIVLTHKHFDHVAGLADVVSRAAAAAIWAGEADRGEIPFEGAIEALDDGVQVRDLRSVSTPGHTPGHRSLLHERQGLLFTGDAAGNMVGALTRGPKEFTEDHDEAERSLRRLESLPWDRLVVSHGDEVADPRRELRGLLSEREPA